MCASNLPGALVWEETLRLHIVTGFTRAARPLDGYHNMGVVAHCSEVLWAAVDVRTQGRVHTATCPGAGRVDPIVGVAPALAEAGVTTARIFTVGVGDQVCRGRELICAKAVL